MKIDVGDDGEVIVEREQPDEFWSVVEKQEKIYGNLSTPEPDWGTDVGAEEFD
ncbi:AbrB family transcriptional regulator [Levilactobacillus humaensis]|uniref:AbrB family transcriptional regulator n=1 Tax=Levilactobacillus humaensis TaxID=2950375 RepID=UPI0021C3E05A|nr:AbrB family transcriptional regulator [Levilactobacillus humaensis]